MYQTLGCFHSLQPTTSPFESPQIPCLTPTGFARWQTLQILLCPDENLVFLQKAVQLWNVPMSNGGTFPKYIPEEVFPSKPDEEMVRWHSMVTGSLNQQKYMQRLKNSPYQSPHPELNDRRDGYFSASQLGRPARPSRSSSRDDSDPLTAYHRRSSVPDFPSPNGERGARWDPRNGGKEATKARSHSAQRPPPRHARQRSQTTSGPPSAHAHKPSLDSPVKARRGAGSTDPSARRSSAQNAQYRSPARTPSTVDEDTVSTASSEDLRPGPRHRGSDEDRTSRRSSLWVPSFMRSHKRRHSSDASYRAPGSKHPPLPRPGYYPPPSNNNPPPQLRQPPYREGNNAPQWRNTNWSAEPPASAPAQGQAHNDPRAPTIRYPDYTNLEPLSRESSNGSGKGQRYRPSDWDKDGGQRRQVPGALPRVPTLTGVQGRKYPTPDPSSPIDRQRTRDRVAALV
jgi:hypothetical protein